MTKVQPNSVVYAINNSLMPTVRQCMEMIGKDPTTCEMCGVKPPKGCDVHHTKYEGATLRDLMFVCRSCNTLPENKGLA